ncbi:class I SAM-dependent methyltransferase [Mycobacterium sp. SMC-2]|uniref:class I SAM-dependent methyltransferase n=1 Tax=Mycobacterium sp. SMC-2 TaxID=2857058 RepID=UPI0021B24F0D|nr:class I SAM-dependent methyltransferase [Mycobacterium sp. SMC-2]
MSEVTNECRLCGSTGPHRTLSVREMFFGTREQFEYFSCAACETLQIVNALEDDELARFYPSDYYSFDVSAEPRMRRWLTTQQDRFALGAGGRPVGALLSALSPSLRSLIGAQDASVDVVKVLGQLGFARDSRILDVGCGGGVLLDRLARVGFNNLSGADPFLAADGQTRHGVPLMKRYLSEVTGEFDLIMFNHSLEHVPDFVATLEAAYEKLAPGGACLVRLPTTSSEAWTIYGSDWVNIDAPRHIAIPSREGMALAADKVGLRVDKTFDDATFLQFIGSEAYKRDIPLTDPAMFWKVLRAVGPKQIWAWQKRAESLNRQGRGDWTGFVLRAR